MNHLSSHQTKKAIVWSLMALTGVTSADVILPVVAKSQLADETRGRILIEELNCVACHASAAPFAMESKKAPRLAEGGSRVHPAYLEAFIREPHGIKPGTTLPDVMPAANREQIATEIAHFLLSLKKSDFAPQPPDVVAAGLGEKLFLARGCAACDSPRDAKGTETMPKDSVPLGAVDKKYSFKSLTAFLSRPHAVRPSGRMPDMRLESRELECITHFLLRDTRVPGHLAYTMYRGKVWQGLGSDEVEAEKAGQVNDFSELLAGGSAPVSIMLMIVRISKTMFTVTHAVDAGIFGVGATKMTCLP